MSDFLVNLARRGAGLAPITRGAPVIAAEPHRPPAIEPAPLLIEEIDERLPPRDAGESSPALTAAPTMDPHRPRAAAEDGVPAPLTPPAPVGSPVPEQIAAPLVQRAPLEVSPAPPALAPPAGVSGREARTAVPVARGDAGPEIVRGEPAGSATIPGSVPAHRVEVPRPPSASPEVPRVWSAPDAGRAVSPAAAEPAPREPAHLEPRQVRVTSRETVLEIRAATPSAPLSVPVVEPARPSPLFMPAAPAPRGTGAAGELPVQVRIGAIELHAAQPPPLAPPAVVTPTEEAADASGAFEAFVRLRRYGSWSR